MRVLFIHPVPPPSILILQKITYHFGIGMMSAVLKQAGHATDYLALHALDRKKFREKIQAFRPNLVGISVTSNQFPLAQEITNFIHEEYRLPVVLGGVHATVRPEETLGIKGAWGICLGEGEYPMLELADVLSRNGRPGPGDLKIENFWFKADGGVIRNPVRPLIQDLDSLPFCDREIVDFQKLLNYHRYLEIRSSRGCPYQCTFCVNSAYQSLYRHKGKYYRARSHENILDEIDLLVKGYKGIRFVVFDDELMSVNQDWTIDFLGKYRSRFSFPFNLTIRANLVNAEYVKALKEAGCNTLMMGVESGDDHIRNDVLRKGITTDEIIEAARLIKEAGITLWTFNMVGVPFETRESIEKTIALNKKIKADIVFVSTFYPYPGTHLEKLCREKGWVSDRETRGFFSNISVLDQPSITKEEVAYYHNIFPWEVLYPRLSSFVKLLAGPRVYKGKSIYDLLFPLVKMAYEVVFKFKITLNL